MKPLKKIMAATLSAAILFSPVFPSVQANAKVTWDNVEIVKGQIGIVTVLKNTSLYNLNEKGKLVAAKDVKKGQKYRVYSIKNENGELYAVGAGLYAQKSNSIQYKRVPSDKIQALGINTTTKTLMEGITYPQFSGLFNKQLERSLNNHFLALAKDAEEGYWELKQQEEIDREEGGVSAPYSLSMKSSVSYNQDNLLSVSLTYDMYSGGAHGMSGIDTYNYNLLKGRQVQLKDIITTPAQLAKVNKFIKNTMKYRNSKGAQFWVEEFKSVNLKEDAFYFTKDGIMIIFGEYEYGPYSNGINFFKVPYSVFK